MTTGDKVILTTSLVKKAKCWKGIKPVPEGELIKLGAGKRKGVALVKFPGYDKPVPVLTLNLRKVK